MFNGIMKISTYFIWIFMTCSVSLVQTEECPEPTFHRYSVFIQYTNNHYSFTEWRQDIQKINWSRSEWRIKSAVKNLILDMNKNVSDVDVHVWRTDCETGNSSRLENIVSDINQCSYNGSDYRFPMDDKSCITVHFKILQLDESPNWTKECEDWLEKFQESCKPILAQCSIDSSGVFHRVLPATILPGVLLVSVVIFIYIKMRVTAKYALSIKDPSYFAGGDEEAQNRLTLDLISAEPGDGDDDDDDDEGQDRLSVGLNSTEGKCSKSMDYFPPTMAGDDDDDDDGQIKLVAGLTPAEPFGRNDE